MQNVHYDSIILLKNTAAEGVTQGDVYVQLAQKVTKTTKTGKPRGLTLGSVGVIMVALEQMQQCGGWVEFDELEE